MTFRSVLLSCVGLALALTLPGYAGAQAPKADRFVEGVRRFARKVDAAARPLVLVGAAADERQRGMWPATWLVVPPASGKPAPAPSPPLANLWYETSTLHTFRILSEMLDDGRPRLAANSYVRDFLTYAPSKESGLLAWGPELSLALADGAVVRTVPPGEAAGHVLLARTPPWDILWDAQPETTARAIAGLELHYLSSTGGKFARRGPYFDAARPTEPSGGCELAGLFAQSFAFLYQKSGQQKWLERAQSCVESAWAKRDPITQLVPDDLWLPTPVVDGAPPEAGADRPAPEPASGSSRQALLGYFLLKAWREAPHETTWGTRGVALIKAYDQYAFDRGAGGWRATVRIDGQPATTPSAHLALWQDVPGQVSIPQWGRIAAYAAQTTQDKGCLEIARKALATCQKAPRPADVGQEHLAHALHLALDLHELTQEKAFLDAATRMGDQALRIADEFRQAEGAPFRVSAGAGYLAAGLLRLHLRIHKFPPAKGYDWTF